MTEGNQGERDEKTSESGVASYGQSVGANSQPIDTKPGENSDSKNPSQPRPNHRQPLGPQLGQAQAISEYQNQQQLQRSQPLSTHGQPQQKHSVTPQTAQGLQLQHQNQNDARQAGYQQGQQALLQQGDRQSLGLPGSGGQPSHGDKNHSQNSTMDQQSKPGSQRPGDFQTGQHASQNIQNHSQRGQPPEQDDQKPSLRPVVAHLRKLRVAVNTAVCLHDAQLAEAQKQEDAVSDQERASLSSKRAALIEEVRAKNERMKLLIDQLRELYRAALTFRNNGSVYFNKASGPMS